MKFKYVIICRKNIQIMNKFMKKNSIDFDTQLRIKRYMHFLWEQERKQTSDRENALLGKLTPNLQFSLLSQTKGKILFPIELFSKNFSQEFLSQLLFIMKPITFDPDSFIYKVSFALNKITHKKKK